MQPKQYFIKKAEKAGQPFTTSHGSTLQPYFLEVEGYEGRTVMLNRQVDKLPPNGPTWGTMTETPKKNKPGTYFKFAIQKSPDGVSAAQQVMDMATGMDEDQFYKLLTASFIPVGVEAGMRFVAENWETTKSLFDLLLSHPKDNIPTSEEVDKATDDSFMTDFDKAISGELEDDLP